MTGIEDIVKKEFSRAFMGYDREFIDSKYDEIIDFAEMREFQNSPFRTLSSGMKSRIAFAIASMIEPDIIILDEIFAVGDGDFRRKAENDMEILARKVGDVMTKNPASIYADSLAIEVLKVVEARKIDDIIVLDAGGKVVGIVDIQDLPGLKLM